ncbi:MAG: DNA-directed RNA polymerase, partial [Candidatus Aenigmarchaeota archaeon]|nr:DNA-directed RNA polymerase [Candidatus Aenigmarchaeota archaeon]
PREMHKVTCADCGNEAEVPFKPDGKRPVYCRDCFNKRRAV